MCLFYSLWHRFIHSISLCVSLFCRKKRKYNLYLRISGQVIDSRHWYLFYVHYHRSAQAFPKRFLWSRQELKKVMLLYYLWRKERSKLEVFDNNFDRFPFYRQFPLTIIPNRRYYLFIKFRKGYWLHRIVNHPKYFEN